MFVSSEQLLFENRMYKDPHHKIQSEVKKKKFFPLKRGLYETDPAVPGYVLAHEIVAPSYLSFEYALWYYSMIPDRVSVYTSATFCKNKKIEIENCYGTFCYKDIPEEVYPYYYTQALYGKRSFLIASKEKALCDFLSSVYPIRGIKDFKEYLFDGMRFAEDIFNELDFSKIRRIAPMYRKTNLHQLLKYINREEL